VTSESAPFNSVGWERIAPGPDTPEGTVRFRLASWSTFFDFLEAEVFDPSMPSKHTYIWRGQRRSDWGLSSSLDRLLLKLGLITSSPEKLDELALQQLETFKFAIRGRRGNNPAIISDQNELWALGQHFGLATPLVDWTRSPFAAAYFAFEELAPDPTDYRVVYGLARNAVQRKSDEISRGRTPEEKGERPPIIELVEPMSDENQRLVSQGGLFTRAPVGMAVEMWVARAFENSPTEVMLQIEIPNSDRLACLRALDRMNINHLSLFPDLTGASRATNLKWELQS
jgi:hypothetical protein